MEEDLNQMTKITEEKEAGRVTKVIIVRHAESVANTEGIYQGQTYDTDLSELGQKQARALAERLRKFSIKRIIASPLKRTHQTAQAVADTLGLTIDFNDKILETNHGVWEGKHKNWISNHFSDLYKLWQERPGDTVFPKGESYMDTAKRTLEFLENEEFVADTLVVTHDNIVRAAIALMTNNDINKIWDIPVETAAINRFEVNKINGRNVFKILKVNETEHLLGVRNDVGIHAL